MRIRVLQTGKVYVSHALPFKDSAKNPNPLQLSLLSLYGRRNRIWLPVSAYLIEHGDYKILVDTGWHRDISPDGSVGGRASTLRRLKLTSALIRNAGSLISAVALEREKFFMR